jgi:DNA-binding PadR family transcriptional regulator
MSRKVPLLRSAGKEANEARPILRSFCRVRLLHEAGIKPFRLVDGLAIMHNRGYTMKRPTLRRMLGRMEQEGWLKRIGLGGGHHARFGYSLTPEGRRVLKSLRKHLQQLIRKGVY